MSKRNDIFGWTNEAMNNIMQRKLKDILDFVSDLKKHISDG